MNSSPGDLIITPFLSRVNSPTYSVYKNVRFIAVSPIIIKLVTTRPTTSPSRIRPVNAEASNHKYTGVQPVTSWGIVYRKTSRPSGRGRKWVAFGVLVKDERNWITAAKNVAMWSGGSSGEWERPIKPGDAWTFANPMCGACARLVALYSSYVCELVLVCLFAVVSTVVVFFIVFSLRCMIDESGKGSAPVFFLNNIFGFI